MDATMSTSIPLAASLRSLPRRSCAIDSVSWVACKGTTIQSAEVDGGVTVAGTADRDALKLLAYGFILASNSAICRSKDSYFLSVSACLLLISATSA